MTSWTRSQPKQDVDADIELRGSGRLPPTLLEHDLVDQLRLMVFPVVLGEGKRSSASDVLASMSRIAAEPRVVYVRLFGRCLVYEERIRVRRRVRNRRSERTEEEPMPIWAWVLIIVLIVFLLGGFGYSRRR